MSSDLLKQWGGMALFNSLNVNGGFPQGARSIISFLAGKAILSPAHFVAYKSLQKIMAQGVMRAYK